MVIVEESLPDTRAPHDVGFWQAFGYWLRLGFISFGGPAGQIAVMHRELVEDAYDLKGGCSFTDGNGCSSGHSGAKLFSGKKFRSPQEFIA